MTVKNKTRFPDELHTAYGKTIRVSQLNPDTLIPLRTSSGKVIKVRASSIPYVIVVLSCGDTTKGIALEVGNVVFCEKHHEMVEVKKIVA